MNNLVKNILVVLVLFSALLYISNINGVTDLYYEVAVEK